MGFPDECMEEIRNLFVSSIHDTAEEDLPEGTRQILLVAGHSMITSNFLLNTSSGKTDSQAVILLWGNPSPSSDPNLKRIYITFIEDNAKVRRPDFNKAGGTIRLWMHCKNMPMVLAQLHEPNVYGWIGHFGQGQIYADIHTSH